MRERERERERERGEREREREKVLKETGTPLYNYGTKKKETTHV